MLDTPQIIYTTTQSAAVIHLTVARSDMMKVFGPAAGEIFSVLSAQGIKPEGPLFAHHLKMSDDCFDFELGTGVSKAVEASGRVRPGELPGVRVARTVYTGPYEGLSAAWAEFMTWISDNGHKHAEDLWERYCIGPQTTPDSAQWRTELTRPLKD
jgi:effector-binding domain-containing protein